MSAINNLFPHFPQSFVNPHIIIDSGVNGWAASASEVVGGAIRETISSRGLCNLMLTGGWAAKQLYSHWATDYELPFDKINLFFGDERCVPPSHPDSNYAMVVQTLLSNNDGMDFVVKRMEAECSDRNLAARHYESLLPEVIDVLLLSMGLDGHIASLFPNSPALRPEEKRGVVSVVGPTPPYERLTITPKVIRSAKSIFLMVVGAEKGKLLNQVLESPSDVMTLPVRLVMNATWLLDSDAGKFFKTTI